MKFNLKKFDFQKMFAKQKDSEWQKSIYVILIIGTFTLIGFLSYIYLAPDDPAIVEQINKDLSTEDIRIDTKTLEKLKSKYYLTEEAIITDPSPSSLNQ